MSDEPKKSDPDTARATPAAKRVELDERNLHGQVKSQGLRLTGVEGRVGKAEGRLDDLEHGPRIPRPTPRSPGMLVEKVAAAHRDVSVEAIRQKSEQTLEREATYAAVLTHNERIESFQRDLGLAVALIAREQGIAKKMPASIQQTLPPPPPEEKPAPPPKTMREQLHEQRKWIAVVIAAAQVVNLALELLHRKP